MADSKENYYWDLGSENLINRDTYAEQGYTQFPLNSTENLIQTCLRNISICSEMPGDAKNYIHFVVDKFSEPLHTSLFLLRIKNLAI